MSYGVAEINYEYANTRIIEFFGDITEETKIFTKNYYDIYGICIGQCVALRITNPLCDYDWYISTNDYLNGKKRAFRIDKTNYARLNSVIKYDLKPNIKNLTMME